MTKKLTAAQKKQVAALVKAAKQSDGKVTWAELDARYEAALDRYDLDAMAVSLAVTTEVNQWAMAARQEYDKIAADVQRIEREVQDERGDGAFVYLHDESVDHMNVTNDGTGTITPESVEYWPAMAGTIGPTIGQRAEDEGLDINARLGYGIY